MKTRLFILSLLPTALLAQDDMWDDEDWGDEGQANTWSGFIEAGLGSRWQNDPLLQNDATLEELRVRIESQWTPGRTTVTLKADVAYDGITDELEADAREATFAFSAGKNIDVKAGRQVQTWGTGDLVFLNDLFPKDFVSFFAGREDQYLKAAGNSIRVTRFGSALNVDFVWSPRFEPDVYLNGERFSFFSPMMGGNVAPQPPMSAIEPGHSFSDGEFAFRLFRTIDGREYALYGYHGHFKQPNALDEDGRVTFAAMTSLGASLRQPLGSGLFNAEFSYYLSSDDRDGSNPLLPNSQFRILAGYEWEARPRFTVGLQYYLEVTVDHAALMQNSFAPAYEPDEYRHLLTNRLTWRSDRDRHTWSLFTFYSPSDNDAYLRPVYTYRHDDHWSVSAGANLFAGEDRHTFFAQLQDSSNAYLRLRYHY
jgi:hypothetical protein